MVVDSAQTGEQLISPATSMASPTPTTTPTDPGWRWCGTTTTSPRFLVVGRCGADRGTFGSSPDRGGHAEHRQDQGPSTRPGNFTERHPAPGPLPTFQRAAVDRAEEYDFARHLNAAAANRIAARSVPNRRLPAVPHHLQRMQSHCDSRGRSPGTRCSRSNGKGSRVGADHPSHHAEVDSRHHRRPGPQDQRRRGHFSVAEIATRRQNSSGWIDPGNRTLTWLQVPRQAPRTRSSGRNRMPLSVATRAGGQEAWLAASRRPDRRDDDTLVETHLASRRAQRWCPAIKSTDSFDNTGFPDRLGGRHETAEGGHVRPAQRRPELCC